MNCQIPRRIAFRSRPYSLFAIRFFIAVFSSARSAYMRLSLKFSAGSAFISFRSEASMPPYFDFHL